MPARGQVASIMDGHLDASACRAVSFERYVLDLSARRLTLNGKAVALPARAFDLLAILVEHRGAAISRERLYEMLWPQGFVEDGNLTQAVYLLRRTLDPSGNGRQFIQTLPRHGYRFAATVKPVPQPPLTMRWNVPPTHALRIGVSIGLALLTLLLSGSGMTLRTIPLQPQAAISYALGVYHWNMRTPEEMKRSIRYFDRTIALSPENPLGYAGLAGVYAIEAEDGGPQAAAYLHLAQRYRDKALARDADNPEAHAVSAFIDQRFRHDFAGAEREFSIVFAIKPDYATAHHWHAVMHLVEGDIAGAVREWEFAHQLDPTSEVISRWLGIAYFYARRPNDAIATLNETINLEPGDHEAWITLANAQEQRGEFAQALTTLEYVRSRVPHKATYVSALEAHVRLASRHGVADRAMIALIQRLAASKETSSTALAYIFAALGKRDEAISALRRYQAKSDWYLSMEKYDPRLDNLRRDPRFNALFD